MRFYDLHIHSNLSIGESSVERLAQQAKALGWSGIAITDNWQGIEKLKQMKEHCAAAQKAVGIEVWPGIKIQADDKSELARLIGLVRDQIHVLIVHGGNYEINRAAVSDARVDILAHPELGRFDNGLDDVCAHLAAENNVSIEINFRQVLSSYRKLRSKILEQMAENIRLAAAFRAPIIVCSGAQSIWEMRDPRQLIAVANVLGQDLAKAFASASDIPAQIIEKNSKRLEGKLVGRGVEIVG